MSRYLSPWQPKPLQQEDLDAIAQAIGEPDQNARTAWLARDRALSTLFIAAGLRACGVIALEVGDRDLASDLLQIWVLGKGIKPRTVPLRPETVIASVAISRIGRTARASPPPGERLIARADGMARPHDLAYANLGEALVDDGGIGERSADAEHPARS